MRNFVPVFCPDCLGSLIHVCGLYCIEESLLGTFCKPKYSTGRLFDRELSVFEANCRAKLLAD